MSKKYALLVDDVVDNISMASRQGYVEVPDTVYAGFIRNEDGTFSAPQPLPPVVDDLLAERDRRLAAGFDFNFGDARGVHEIGTAPSDMTKWMQEVTPLAQISVAGGAPATEITISTNTGVVTVTAQEWLSIIAYSATVRQPIYQGYFTLKAMNPIPADYASNEAYWSGS